MSILKEKEVIEDGEDHTNELQDNAEEKPNTISAVRKKATEQHHQQKAKAYKDMPKGNKKAQVKAKFVSNHTLYSTVEPVLATLVNYLNMRRVNTRGIRQANKWMLMAAVAYNLLRS